MTPLICLVGLLTTATEALTVEQTAVISHEQKKAQSEVSKRFGNRSLSQMSNDERAEMMRAQKDADDKVLAKHKVDGKDWAQHTARQTPAVRAAVAEKIKALVEGEAAAAAKAKTDAAAAAKAVEKPASEIVVEKGAPRR